MDNLSRQARTRAMKANRGVGGKSTELRLRAELVRASIRGWKFGHKSGVEGKPDFCFLRERVVIFVDGCFWHGCSACRSLPSTNRVFWQQKISRNVARDRAVTRSLVRGGWQVIRVWEHELRVGEAKRRVIRRVNNAL